MSSTSSSECECDEYWPYETGFNKKRFKNGFGGNPFYPTMGHPLIYYAQVPQPVSVKQCRRERRRNSPNCFVKAFRWYTEDHVSNKNMSPNANPPDISGFATWLDMKYDQFVKESRVDSSLYHVQVKQTSVIEAGSVPKSGYCVPCETKRFPLKSDRLSELLYSSSESKHSFYKIQNLKKGRHLLQPPIDKTKHFNMKPFSNVPRSSLDQSTTSQVRMNATTLHFNVPDSSPRRKKRRAKSNETGDVRQKSNQSFQYILQPKDISRPASDSNRASNATVISESSKRTVTKSQSLSNVIKSRETVDVPPFQEGTECKNSVCQNDTRQQELEQKSSMTEQLSSKNKIENQNFSCQYTEEKAMKIDVETQYNVLHSAVTLGCESELVDECACQLPYEKARSPVRAAESSSKMTQRCTVSRDHIINTICQCTEEKVIKVDAQTQYEVQEPNRTSALRNKGCECDFEELMRNYPPPAQSTSKKNDTCFCGRTIKVASKEKPTVKFLQNVSQTSNHSIRFAPLGEETVHEYPLFMKIVCADKLSNEHFK